MILSVVGCGYLGAVHATSMAHLGHQVRAYDVDAEKISALSRGEPPFYEPGFNELLKDTLKTGRLLFTNSPETAIRGAVLHFICVGTPQQSNSGSADLSHVDSAFQTIVQYADRPGTIVGKSTVPAGTARRLAEAIHGEGLAHPLQVAWCPEFLREGSAIADTLNPDRLVFGVTNRASEIALLEVFELLLEAGIPYITTDLETAEMVKMAANCFLATKISFINAMSEICDSVNADVVTLSLALGFDDRIGNKFLDAGLGFGGGCLPKDLRALSALAGELRATHAQNLLQAVDLINLHQRERTISRVESILGHEFSTMRVAILGAAFKPNSDDVRDSPALVVASALHHKGVSVRIHDPHAIENSRKLFPSLNYSDTIEEASQAADLIVHATSWAEYDEIDPGVLITQVRRPRLLDTRNSLDLQHWSQAGWQVFGLGRTGATSARSGPT